MTKKDREKKKQKEKKNKSKKIERVKVKKLNFIRKKKKVFSCSLSSFAKALSVLAILKRTKKIKYAFITSFPSVSNIFCTPVRLLAFSSSSSPSTSFSFSPLNLKFFFFKNKRKKKRKKKQRGGSRTVFSSPSKINY